MVAAVKIVQLTSDFQKLKPWNCVYKLTAVIVEIDRQEVANLVNNKQGSKTKIFWVVSEIQSMCKDVEIVTFCTHF